MTTGIFDHAGEPGVEAGSEDATCRGRAAKESMETLEAEERMKECGSRGEFGDVDVVAGGGAGNQDQEARAQKCRREHGEEERRHRRGACVIYIYWCRFGLADFAGLASLVMIMPRGG